MNLYIPMLFVTLVSKKFCFFRDGQVIAVVYFRAGYTPNDYPSESVSNFLIQFLLLGFFFSYFTRKCSCLINTFCYYLTNVDTLNVSSSS